MLLIRNKKVYWGIALLAGMVLAVIGGLLLLIFGLTGNDAHTGAVFVVGQEAVHELPE